MARKKKDKLIAVKLNADELTTLDGLCDAYETDRSKIVRLALRMMHEETKRNLGWVNSEEELKDNATSILRNLLLMRTNPRPLHPTYTKEEAEAVEEYERHRAKEPPGIRATKQTDEGGDANDEK